MWQAGVLAWMFQEDGEGAPETVTRERTAARYGNYSAGDAGAESARLETPRRTGQGSHFWRLRAPAGASRWDAVWSQPTAATRTLQPWR